MDARKVKVRETGIDDRDGANWKKYSQSPCVTVSVFKQQTRTQLFPFDLFILFLKCLSIAIRFVHFFREKEEPKQK